MQILLKHLTVLFLGYIIGVMLAVTFFRLKNGQYFWENQIPSKIHQNIDQDDYYWKRDNWVASDDNTYVVPWPAAVHSIDYLMHIHKGEDKSVAEEISENVSVFCIVITSASGHQNRSRLVKETWGHRCDQLLFISTESDADLPAVALNTSLNDLWGREKEMIQYIYNNHRYDAEWFLRANDETYIIMENLKYMLEKYAYSQAMFFNSMPEDNIVKGVSFNAGYVLSKPALRKLANKAHLCNSTLRLRNIVMEQCLRNLKIKMMDTRDSEGRGRFFPYKPTELSVSSFGASDYAISFHKIACNYLYLMEFFVYHLRAFGIVVNFTATSSGEE